MPARRSRPRIGPWCRAAALLVLASQVFLGALPHTDRLPDRQDYLSTEAGAAALAHAGICEACVLSHVPAAPGAAAETAPPLATMTVAPPRPATAIRSATPTVTRSRAPPVFAI